MITDIPPFCEYFNSFSWACQSQDAHTAYFSTLVTRVLKINDLVTHYVPLWLIIQTVSKNKLISKNAY